MILKRDTIKVAKYDQNIETIFLSEKLPIGIGPSGLVKLLIVLISNKECEVILFDIIWYLYLFILFVRSVEFLY